MKFLFISLLVLLCLFQLGKSECCDRAPCSDGTNGGGFCCGVGDCNIFCCNCDNGCRKAKCSYLDQYCTSQADNCYVGCTMGPQVSGCEHACDVAQNRCLRQDCTGPRKMSSVQKGWSKTAFSKYLNSKGVSNQKIHNHLFDELDTNSNGQIDTNERENGKNTGIEELEKKYGARNQSTEEL